MSDVPRPPDAAPSPPDVPHRPDAGPSPPGAEAASGAGVLVKERAHPASPLVRLWLGIVAVGWVLLQELLPGGGIGQPRLPIDRLLALPWWMAVLFGGVLLGLALGYWGWWTTWFIIDDHEVRVENRGAFAESRRIAFNRIQSVDISQPFAARILGLASLTIDAGADTGTKLSFLPRARATQLRDYLMARAHGQRAATGGPSSAWTDLGAADRVLIRLNPLEIIVGALLSGELVGIVVGFGVPAGIAVATGAGWIGALALLPAMAIAVIGYLSRRMFAQFNYTLAVTPAGLRITRGLTTLKSQTIPAHRVQAILISQPLIWRWLDRYRLDVTVLGLGDLDGGDEVSTATIFLPIGSPQQVRTALHALWPGLDLGGLSYRGSPPVSRWLDPLAFSWNGFALDERVLVARQGFFNRRQYVVPHARLQSVRLTQGPLERRLGLADLALHTTNALGDDRVVHLDPVVARQVAFDETVRSRTAHMRDLLNAR